MEPSKLSLQILTSSNNPFVEKPVDWFLLVGYGMVLLRGVFCRILLVETGYLVSLYVSNFIFYFIYDFIISFSFHGDFNIFLRNIWGDLGLPWSLGWDFLWRKLRLVAESSISDFVVVLAASLDINCLHMYFMTGVNSLFIEFVNTE